MIKHVSFDLFGTLIKSPYGYKVSRANLVSGLLSTRMSVNIDIGRVASAISTVEHMQSSLAHIANSQMNVKSAWITILSILNIPIDSKFIERLVKECEDHYLMCKVPLCDENTTHILKQITTRGITMSILSNTCLIEGHVIRKQLKRLGIFGMFKCLRFSDEDGFVKPSIESFHTIMCNMQINSSDWKNVLYVGDNEETDGGCKNLGIQFLKINGVTGKTISDVLKFINA